jgi:peptide/nickel transport system ATP-binding protein
MTSLLKVKDLSVSFSTDDGKVQATRHLSFELNQGETLAIVGESGSGKSVSSMAIMGLHDRKSAEISGEILLNEESGTLDVVKASELTLEKLRGKSVSMIFQDPMSALHPYYSVGEQMAEAWLVHNDGTKDVSISKAVEMLKLVGIPDAEKRVYEFPHQFSGGMRQRVLIAMALINRPKILIADEPTTALDVTVQLQILNLLKSIQKELQMSIILITHDMGVVAEVADRINVMYGGTLVESGTVKEIFENPLHPYTKGLLASLPRVDHPHGTRLKAISGQPPSLINLPKGCTFAPRCEFVNKVPNNLCNTREPDLELKKMDHLVRCYLNE